MRKAEVIRDVRTDIEEGARELSKRARQRQEKADAIANNTKFKKQKSGGARKNRFDDMKTKEIARDMREWRKELRTRETKVR